MYTVVKNIVTDEIDIYSTPNPVGVMQNEVIIGCYETLELAERTMPPNTDTANRAFNNAERLDTLLPEEVEKKFGNLLVRQKDYILASVNRGDYRTALVTLHCVRELWYSMNYGYKFEEILRRIKEIRPRKQNYEST